MSLYHTPIASEFQEDRNTGDGSVSVPGVQSAPQFLYTGTDTQDPSGVSAFQSLYTGTDTQDPSPVFLILFLLLKYHP